MAFSVDDAAFLRLLAKSADRALADRAEATLAGLVLKFDPDELRDDHGRWSAVGAAVHVIEHTTDGHPPVDPKRDQLKLGGKIELDPGEHLVGSSKLAEGDGSIRMAATDLNGQRHLRLGVGNWAFGVPNKSEGTVAWTGGPDHFDAAQAARDARGKEHERLEEQWDATPEGPERDAIEARLEALEDEGSGGEVLGGGHTMRLNSTGIAQMHAALADALPAKQAEADHINGLYDELDKLDARLDHFHGKDARDERYTADEKAEFARALARRKELDRILGVSSKRGPTMAPAIDGDIPGEWGTLHYEAYVDEPSEGPRLMLAVVPHGQNIDDVLAEEGTYTLSADEWGKLLQQVDGLTADGTGKASEADLLKWTYNPNQSRVGGRFASGTGSNITSGGDVQVSGRQGTSVVAIKPINAAAARLSSGKPVNGAAARLTPQVKPPPPRPAGKPKPKPKPAGKPETKPAAKPAPKPTPGPEAATRSPHTAIGSQDGDRLTVSHRATTQTRQADARRWSHQAAVRAQQRQELAAVRASLAAARAKAKASKATTRQRDAAVNAMRSKYGIPKSLRHVSKDRQQAAADMSSATRQMVTDRARIATAQAQVAAVRAQYKKGQSAATTTYLNSQLAKAQARLNAANSSLSQAQGQFNAAAKKWRGH